MNLVINLLSFTSVLKSVGSVLLAVGILLAMVTVHEFGHYVAGKILGFKINEFAVGFGPAIFKRRSKRTGELFALRVIPLGGYCAFDGEDEFEDEAAQKGEESDGETADDEPFAELVSPDNEVQETEKDGGRDLTNEETDYPEPKGERFNDQPPWKRIIVLIAGATMNYLLALVLLFIMFGSYGCIHSYVGFRGETPPTASEEVLNARDIVLSVNGQDIYLATDYADALSGIKQGEEIVVEILRKDDEGVWREKTLRIVAAVDCNFKSMTQLDLACTALGLDPQLYGFASVTLKEGFWETVGSSFVYSFKIGGTVLRSLGELVTGRIGLDSMGGPVTTIGVTAQAASSSFLSFLNIAAFIGVNLAVFNLLPIPALDGCKVIFCIIEWIRKKPVNRKVETMIHFIGIIALFAFAILVDLLQLFT